ncbi:MAG: Crp/Fnr family transcriptional regulator [Hyphomonadaceae bacterium]|nr:Crp/Fnr family transcriptional regulator [Hyphomonadaceae bacterium]
MLDLLAKNTPSFMDHLSDNLRDEISRAGTIVRYQDGQLIHNRGDMKPGISIVVSGAVQVGIFGEDGTFIMTSHLGMGQTFGEFTLFANLPRTHDITAAGDTQINQIPAQTFHRLYDARPEISRALLTTSLVRTHRLLEMMDAMRRLPMRERTAKVLWTLIQTAGDVDKFECRQSDLAFALGVSRTSLSTALKQLAVLGLVKTGYGQITLPDPEKMKDWVGAHCAAA